MKKRDFYFYSFHTVPLNFVKSVKQNLKKTTVQIYFLFFHCQWLMMFFENFKKG